MARPLRYAVLWGVLAPVAVCLACGDDTQLGAPLLSDAGDAHATGEAAQSSTGGNGGGGGNAGAPPTGTGGRGGSVDGGTGTGSQAGAAGAGGGGQGGSDSGADGSVSVALSLCVRLQSPSVLSFDITRAYDHRVYADCRVKWVSNLYLEVDQREVFLNNLLAWNMRFWGCTPPPPDNFALIFKTAPLTLGDVSALIDDYIEVATQPLGLSAPEIAEMRAALLELANSVVATPSNGLSKSQCTVEAGAGGAGGGGSTGSGGTGGAVTGAGGTGGTRPADASTDTGADAAKRNDASTEAATIYDASSDVPSGS